MWPFLSGQVKDSPRDTIPIGSHCIIQGNWKLITTRTTPDFWQGPTYPNSSSLDGSAVNVEECASGCLFNVVDDFTEQKNVYTAHPDIVTNMSAKLKTLKASFFGNKDNFSNDCPSGTKNCACWMAKNRYDGFMGPYALTSRQSALV